MPDQDDTDAVERQERHYWSMRQDAYLKEIRNWVRFLGIVVVVQLLAAGYWLLEVNKATD